VGSEAFGPNLRVGHGPPAGSAHCRRLADEDAAMAARRVVGVGYESPSFRTRALPVNCDGRKTVSFAISRGSFLFSINFFFQAA
jgi:hypothetical protein